MGSFSRKIIFTVPGHPYGDQGLRLNDHPQIDDRLSPQFRSAGEGIDGLPWADGNAIAALRPKNFSFDLP
jgi:hypothetical protein